MRPWRLLDTGVRTAAENMALDEAVLEARGRGLVPDTLRFLQFSPPASLVGYHQSVAQEIRSDFCHSHGIDVNRRLTGGGAIYFDESQLGWEIIAGMDSPFVSRDRTRLFSRMAEGAVAGLRNLRIDASFRPRNDIEVNGRKISGLGAVEGEGAFLFQGTLLLDFDVDTMLRALRVPVEKLAEKEIRSLRDRVTWVSREIGRAPPLEVVKLALRRGFEEALGVSFEEGPLANEEAVLLEERLPCYASEEWIDQSQAPYGQEVFRSAYKTKGGLVRVALVVDSRMKRIKAAVITGDFFAYPRRAIMDLEAALKDAPAEAEPVGRIVDEFFRQGRGYLPGVGPADLSRVLAEALERGDYGRYGIAPEEAGSVYTVGKPLAQMPRCSVLLLPYCAKSLGCDFRNEDGCIECGNCSTGEAYRLARDKGLRPISIVNYEHLQETLVKCRIEGEPAFVGACCDAFYSKHRQDFEEAGLPGVLVDIDSTTCYDLGEESQAYRGRFERQTNLRLGLLAKVVDALVGSDPQTPLAGGLMNASALVNNP